MSMAFDFWSCSENPRKRVCSGHLNKKPVLIWFWLSCNTNLCQALLVLTLQSSAGRAGYLVMAFIPNNDKYFRWSWLNLGYLSILISSGSIKMMSTQKLMEYSRTHDHYASKSKYLYISEIITRQNGPRKLSCKEWDMTLIIVRDPTHCMWGKDCPKQLCNMGRIKSTLRVRTSVEIYVLVGWTRAGVWPGSSAMTTARPL